MVSVSNAEPFIEASAFGEGTGRTPAAPKTRSPMVKHISSFLILAFTVFATAIGSAQAAQSSQQSQQPVLVGSDAGANNPASDGTWWKD